MYYYGEPDIEYYDAQHSDGLSHNYNASSSIQHCPEGYYEFEDNLNTDTMVQSSPSPIMKHKFARQGYRMDDHYAETNLEYENGTFSDSRYARNCTSQPPYRWDPNLVATTYDHSSDPVDQSCSLYASVNSQTRTGPGNNLSERSTNQETLPPSKKIRLRPVSELPDIYRSIFKFGVFNAVQSSCFDSTLHSRENLVVSAPTGSGKTVLFELAIIKMLTEAKESGQSLKCVYVAPTKALCSEKYKDWSAKFDPLGCELTGDTVHAGYGKSALGDAESATIIVTTGEKWDSLTRNWSDHNQTLSQIQLFLVDEVHILNESRGSTLEVVVSRMKLRGCSVRFVLVSATIPNIRDLASWVGRNDSSDGEARIFEFGEDFRPCKLTRHVIGIPRSKHQNDFAFARVLDGKLFKTLQTYSVGKPILVFVSTRKDLANIGIGVHHAGLSMDDRRHVEELYLGKTLRIVIATTTLAVGVNLPAHTVVIRGVYTFQKNAMVEYSDLDIMQMMGRAGRPQFDKDGIAVILCESDLEAKYCALAQGKTVVESSLHINLSEHLNSEIGLGTINNVSLAKEWLRSSFLFQRIRRNPSYYSLGKDTNQTWEDRIDDIVMQSVDNLRKSKLIASMDETGDIESLVSTDYGDIMSKFYIRQQTMTSILALTEKPTLRDVLELITVAEELFSELKLRSSERTAYNKLRKHNDIRFEVKKLEKTSDKISLLIQAVLGGISLNHPDYRNNDSQLQLEAFGVFRHLPRIARGKFKISQSFVGNASFKRFLAVVEVAVVRKRGAQLKHGLELFRCFTAKAWEDRPVILRQIESIGEKSLKVLAEHGITSVEILRKQDSLRLETLLNRRPPFGLELLASLNEFPQYSLNVVQQRACVFGGKRPIEIDLLVKCGLVQEESKTKTKLKKQRNRFIDMTAVLTLTSDMEFIDFRRIPTKVLKETKGFEITAILAKPSQLVIVMITSESYAGVAVSKTFRPTVPAEEYPTKNTKPMTVLELELEGLENCPDLFEMGVDEFGNELNSDSGEPVMVKDSTQSNKKDDGHPHLVALPVKLPNGKYRCNHPCKDKTVCRHLCCREGLVKPPKTISFVKTPSTQGPPTIKSQTSSNVSKATQPSKPKSQKAPLREDRTLKTLENLHKITNVEENLKLPRGRRLKLEPEPSSSARPRKKIPTPDFDIQLSSIGEDEPAVDVALQELDEEDDFPDPSEILGPRNSFKRKTPDDPYSDSEIDALIGEHVEETPSKKSSSPIATLSTEVTRKHQKAAPQAHKRPKLDTQQVHAYDSSTPAGNRESLFLCTSDDDKKSDDDEIEFITSVREPTSRMDTEGLQDCYDDCSTLSSPHFDLTDTPDSSMTTGQTSSLQDDDLSLDEIHVVDNEGRQEHNKSAMTGDDDEFAALEAWLDSSAVRIIP
ncbi:P-loop containing nucleoside triphosphate hydrolase protein [Dendrothele bispora CBS 962.96]|uniref:DNA 3'-5' helicase n=1 Tax=Dendrothele bispora (strain CBS 962.96) TaxID=1314807 RepID=A0A4S8LHK9_DENBC|nr:P-loop containing nucleoside triphosphate hydrolase protein [Dendrothele bispora CBS 962.96]